MRSYQEVKYIQVKLETSEQIRQFEGQQLKHPIHHVAFHLREYWIGSHCVSVSKKFRFRPSRDRIMRYTSVSNVSTLETVLNVVSSSCPSEGNGQQAVSSLSGHLPVLSHLPMRYLGRPSSHLSVWLSRSSLLCPFSVFLELAPMHVILNLSF